MITRLADGKKYLGMKSFTVKNWPYYKSSSKELAAEINSHGQSYLEHFRFDMLFTCPNKSGLRSAEMELQYLLDVIHREDFYNTHIGGMRWCGANKESQKVKKSVYKVIESGHYNGIQ